MTGLVSVIVPVYNVAPYLRECVRSICAQTYPDLEIILVDDGSTDGSSSICDEFAAMDNRIHVFHKTNGGVASARNYGLDHATGEWVLLVDSDDSIRHDLVATSIEALGQAKADIAMYQYQSIDEAGNPHPYDGPLNRFSKEMVLSRDEAIVRVINGPYEFYPWCYIARRALYEKIEPIRFPEGRLMEDEATVYKPHVRARSVIYLPYRFYYYRQRASSRMKSSKASALAVARAENAWEMYLFLREQTLPQSVYRSMMAKVVEKEISAYYGALRAGSSTLDSAFEYVKSVLTDRYARKRDLSMGLRVRLFAMKHHLAGVLVVVERKLKR